MKPVYDMLLWQFKRRLELQSTYRIRFEIRKRMFKETSFLRDHFGRVTAPVNTR